ncbi:DNA-binding transcriptional activator of the SARP family [Modestobacter sp. DSM 44400]|uniref:ATP-binding protein n=1 Tax=Modestobacter sp. DSM 44400 TaxID=1550230 RepID=UPI00089BCC4E|nr:AAA family ATPase [Modestobacter sp. DSM 44400]SDY77942.1 DNA-binding transcriptional activator of the SARP family [Modestobacter sp. DSM 44400]
MNASRPGVRVELLGTFRVVVGQEVPSCAWPGRRSAELVQLLALADGHRLLKDQVVDALWPHLGPEAGGANLRKAAHHARRALGHGDAVVLSGGRVALFPTLQVQTDVARFERKADAALRSRDGVACAVAAAEYSGDLLPDSLYEEWTQARRGQLRSLYVELLRMAGQWDRLVEVEPSDERAYRELIRAALADGNRHAAIRWYGRLRTNLQRELGLPPGPESQTLYQRCVAGLRRGATTFVGRQVELARATVALEAAGRGGLGALVVRGPAGIGKSALCGQIASSAGTGGWLVVPVVASLASGPYAALANAVDQLVSRDRTLLDAVGERTRSTLGELTPLAGPGQPPRGGLTRHMVIGAFRRLVTACSNVVGVMLLIDDAHLADDATAEACAHLAHAGGGLPLVVVLAYRPELARPTLAKGVAGLTRTGRSLEIDLGPLDRHEVVALVEAAASKKPNTGSIARIAAMAEGNPFFTLELARGISADQPLTIGPSVWGAVTARFLDVDDTTTETLRRLAVAGDDLDPADASALTGLPEPDAFALLDAALQAGTLVVSRARYRFRHELVRQALIEQVPPHRRIVIHRDTARRLTDAGAAPALIAHHWLEGRRPDEASGWLLAAARQAVKLGAFTDALSELDRLLAHAPDHGEALCLRAEALDALGDLGAPAAYAAAARAVGEPAAHELLAKQALAQIKLGDPPGALQTLATAHPVTVEGRLAQALTLSGAAALGFADPELGTRKAAESRRLALQSGDTSALVVASWAQAAAAHARGDLRGSVQADLRETHALDKLAISVFDGQLCITQRLLYGARPYPDVVAFADSLAAEAERLGAARGHAFALTLRGEARLLSGRLDQADADLRTAARLNRAIGAAVGEALALQRRAEVALYRGRTADAVALIDEALAVARESDVGFHLFDRIYGTRITAATDPSSALVALEEAESAVRGPRETCPGCRITFVVPAAIAAARGGHLDRARQHAETAEFLATVVMRLPAWNAAIEEVKGHLALATGDVGGADAHFRTAADGFRECGQPLDEARCLAPLGCSAPPMRGPIAGNVSGTPG